jgi:hypothetical protein
MWRPIYGLRVHDFLRVHLSSERREIYPSRTTCGFTWFEDLISFEQRFLYTTLNRLTAKHAYALPSSRGTEANSNDNLQDYNCSYIPVIKKMF